MRILLVEDEPDLGEIIEKTLKRENYIVDRCTDGQTAWNCLALGHTQYMVAIFDWLLPGLSGLQLCQRLRAQGQTLPVLMLTAKDAIEDRVQGLDAGADDYLVKPFSNAELLARLRALRRRSPLNNGNDEENLGQKLQQGDLVLDYQTYRINHVLNGEKTISLTAKEFQLLDYLMQHPNQILNREQITNQVWSMEADPISNVVPAQMRLLRKKLATLGLESIIETVHGLGYCLKVEKA